MPTLDHVIESVKTVTDAAELKKLLLSVDSGSLNPVVRTAQQTSEALSRVGRASAAVAAVLKETFDDWKEGTFTPFPSEKLRQMGFNADLSGFSVSDPASSGLYLDTENLSRRTADEAWQFRNEYLNHPPVNNRNTAFNVFPPAEVRQPNHALTQVRPHEWVNSWGHQMGVFRNAWGDLDYAQRWITKEEIEEAEAAELEDSHDENELDRGPDCRLRRMIETHGFETCFSAIDPEDLLEEPTRTLWAARDIPALTERLCLPTATIVRPAATCSTMSCIRSPRPAANVPTAVA